MKRFLLLTVFCCVVYGIAAEQAVCQTTGKGIGIVIGEPTGISGKMWMNRDIAVSGAAAWSFSREEYISRDYC